MKDRVLKAYYGFTLTELLVVIAISIVLLGLLLVPVIKTLEANRMTAAYTNAQQNSRQAISMIRKDISEAMYVVDSGNNPMLLPVNGLVDANGSPIDKPVVLQYGVINLMMPKTEFYCKNPNHNSNYPRNFARGENYDSNSRELAMNECPYCHTDEYVTVVPKIPVEKSTTVVRYFLGLRDNGSDSSPLMTTVDSNIIDNWTVNNGCGWLPDSGNTKVEGDENALILYRAEFDPVSDNQLFPAEYRLSGLSEGSEEYQKRLAKRISDPNVFYHPDCCEAWAAISQNVGMLEGLDLAVALDSDYIDGYPCAVKNVVNFTPAAISGETPTANASSSYSQDDQTAPATTFKTKYTLLGSNIEVQCVRVNQANQRPVAKWVSKLNGNRKFADIFAIPNARLNDVGYIPGNSDLEFNVNNYMFNTYEVSDFNQEMAFVYDKDKGYIEFALNPVSWNNLNDNINQSNLLYYPELDIYSYKFNPYKNATIVPGSEDIRYYNAYWLDSNNYSFMELNYNYNDMYSNVDVVKYQRAPFSLGQLNYNQYKIDYEEGVIYWKPLLPNDTANGIYPVKFSDIPRVDSYKIQFNHKSDKITVSYLTNEVIDVNINMRMIWDPYKPARNGSINERVVVGNSLK